MTGVPADQLDLDWDALEQEMVSLLSEYITLDTSNPPGNEAIAARWFGELLRREGIESEYYESAVGRESLIARLPGTGVSGSADAVMLLNHTDVVPAQPEFWREPPFDGVVRDGLVWGRGAQDMKSLGIMEYLTFVLFKRLSLPHRRELVFFAIADEEAGGEVGVEWFARHHPELLRAWVVINEGGSCMSSFMGTGRPIFGVGAAEKSPLWLRLRTEGRPGHGSQPHKDNALDRMVHALQRVTEWKRERRILPEAAPFLDAIASVGVIEPVDSLEAAERAAALHPLVNALTMDTISLTTMNAGVKVNVIPGSCEATLDCRLLPDRGADEFVVALRAQIDDPRVAIERIFESQSLPSPLDHELMAAVRDVVHEQLEDAIVVPFMGAGFTDSRAFRRLGTPAYGFAPAPGTDDERSTVHGHDERMQTASLRLGLQLLFEVVRRLAG